MGYRTVVILYNDETSKWSKDEFLGQKIQSAANQMEWGTGKSANLGYGCVVECAYADTITFGFFDSYRFVPLCHSVWWSGRTNDSIIEDLFKKTAEHYGYDLVKKSTGEKV